MPPMGIFCLWSQCFCKYHEPQRIYIPGLFLKSCVVESFETSCTFSITFACDCQHGWFIELICGKEVGDGWWSKLPERWRRIDRGTRNIWFRCVSTGGGCILRCTFVGGYPRSGIIFVLGSWNWVCNPISVCMVVFISNQFQLRIFFDNWLCLMMPMYGHYLCLLMFW
jgi:hypothetical protein